MEIREASDYQTFPCEYHQQLLKVLNILMYREICIFSLQEGTLFFKVVFPEIAPKSDGVQMSRNST